MADAAELIARLKVAGEDKYNSALKQAGQTIMEVGSRAQVAGAHLMNSLNKGFELSKSGASSLIGSMGALKVGMLALGAAAVATGAGFLAFTKSAVEEATHIERLKFTYAALSGSLDMAGQKIKFLKQYAKGSINPFDDLAQAGTILEASGLRMERFIPLVDTLAGVFGGGKEQVMELSEALGRLTSGQMGESERIFRRFGITMADFARAGLRMGKNGEIAGSTEQILGAFESVVKRKFGKFGELAKDSMAVKFSALKDSWNGMLDAFGKGWFPFITKVLNSVTPFMEFLNEGGFMKGLGQLFGSKVDNLFGVGDGKGMQKMLAYVAATAEQIPLIFGHIAEAAKAFFQWFGEEVVGLYNTIGQGWAVYMNGIKETARHAIDAVRGFMADLVDAIRSIGQGLSAIPGLGALGPATRNVFGGVDTDKLRTPLNSRSGPEWLFKQDHFKPVSGFEELLKRQFQDLMKSIGEPFGADGGNLSKRADELFRSFEKWQKEQGSGPDGSKYGMFNDSYTPAMAQHLANIDHSTAHMADFKRLMAGGGDLAAMGVTPAEMYAGKQHEIRVNGGHPVFNQWLQEQISEALTQIQRQGPFMNGLVR